VSALFARTRPRGHEYGLSHFLLCPFRPASADYLRSVCRGRNWLYTNEKCLPPHLPYKPLRPSGSGSPGGSGTYFSLECR